MGAGSFAVTTGLEEKKYNGFVTAYVAFATVVAASGGLMFGYDIGITGGVSAMKDFLEKFFPEVVGKPPGSVYCKYDNQGLQAFTSSLYLAGMVSSVVASYPTRVYGRCMTMLLAGISLLIGAILNASAVNLAMLIIGRILLGFGVGFGNQVVPMYLSEIAPYNWRGSMNMMFQFATTIGILSANCINYGTDKLTPWGWRLSLGLAIIPAATLAVGGLFLPDSPNSLVERGRHEEGRAVLQRIRGVADVDDEFKDLVEASRVANLVKHPFRNLLQRRNLPQLVLALFCPFFQIATGINSVLFYAPQIFQIVGFGTSASLYSSIIVGATLSLSCVVGIYLVDRAGRMKLFYEGGVQMFVCLFAVGIIFKEKIEGDSIALDKSWGAGVVVLICLFVAGFGWSWGSLGWTVPSEIFALETRSAGQSVVVAVNFLFTFGIGQALLTMLCHFQYGTFFFFGSWVFIMTIFAALFIPETRHVHLEDMPKLWRSHWFWKRFVGDEPSAFSSPAYGLENDSKVQVDNSENKITSPAYGLGYDDKVQADNSENKITLTVSDRDL